MYIRRIITDLDGTQLFSGTAKEMDEFIKELNTQGKRAHRDFNILMRPVPERQDEFTRMENTR